jgi:hypothetical protein
LEGFEMSAPSNFLGMTESSSRATARKSTYRKTSAVLGLAAGVLNLIALPYVYFLLEPLLFVSALLMLAGGMLIWYRNAVAGAVLVLVGGFFGGSLGLPSLLWALLANALGDWVYSLPLLPLGLILPIASLILAFMSREPFTAKPLQSQ